MAPSGLKWGQLASHKSQKWQHFVVLMTLLHKRSLDPFSAFSACLSHYDYMQEIPQLGIFTNLFFCHLACPLPCIPIVINLYIFFGNNVVWWTFQVQTWFFFVKQSNETCLGVRIIVVHIWFSLFHNRFFATPFCKRGRVVILKDLIWNTSVFFPYCIFVNISWM